MTRQSRPVMKLDAQGRALPTSGDWTTFRGDYYAGTTNLKYAGMARPGASTGDSVWQIAYCTYDASNNITSILYPEDAAGVSTADYIFEYDNRALYTYS